MSGSFVSQVERGVANPSVASLRPLAEAFDTSVGSLFDGPLQSGILVRKVVRPRLVHLRRNWVDSLITPRDARRLQVILSVIEPGEGSGDEAYSHESDKECVLMLEGTLDFLVGDESYVLKAGDSLTFESRIPHNNHNPGPGRAEVLWIMTPPSY